MEYPKFKVCCRCFTFNHSKYITDAMNGFTIQQTSFPFICTIVDDASTDGEQEVIRKYVEENFDYSEGSVAYQKETDYALITYAQHKTNKNCYFAVLYLKENHYSQCKPKMGYLSEWRDMCEYEALCEGDDYWIVQDKLEKQVNYLDSHENVVLVHTDNKNYIQNTGEFVHPIRCFNTTDTTLSLIRGDFYISTLTVMVRRSVVKKMDTSYTSQKFLMGDLPMWIELSRMGEIVYLPSKTAIYRVLPNSAAHSESRIKRTLFDISVRKIRVYFSEKFGYKEYLSKAKKDLWYQQAILLALQKKVIKAIYYFFKSKHFRKNEQIFFWSRFIMPNK